VCANRSDIYVIHIFVSSDLMDPSGQKPKDTKTWKDRMAKKFKRYGSSSSASADMPETSESSEITGTFGVPLEACPCSSFSEVSWSENWIEPLEPVMGGHSFR